MNKTDVQHPGGSPEREEGAITCYGQSSEWRWFQSVRSLLMEETSSHSVM